tara:strand:- start:2688 stop:3146 length:459 start_codon:yes stop_codon:yes gene_type:complete
MLPLSMIHETENYELLSVKKIIDFHGAHIRHDIYMRIKATGKIKYLQLEEPTLQMLVAGYTKKLEVTSEVGEIFTFTFPQDIQKFDKWTDMHPNYKVKRLDNRIIKSQSIESLETFIKIADGLYENTDNILVEVPSSFDGEENYTNEPKRIY